MPQRKCPSKILLILERAPDENLYLMSQLGPTSWLVGEALDENVDETTEYRVSLGERHSCTCSAFRVTKDICYHLGWILRKKLKLKPSDPMCYQLGMTDRELNSLLNPTRPARVRPVVRREVAGGETRTAVRPRKYRSDDPCPICLEKFSKKSSPVVHCKYSCGQPMHGHCMQVVAKHQKDAINLICPLCRGEFSTRIQLQRMIKSSLTGVWAKLCPRSSSLPPLVKHDVKCILCDALVAGSLFKCLNCPNVITCSVCVTSVNYSIHSEHGLVVKNSPLDKWKITTVKRDQHSGQIKRALPRLVRSGKKTNLIKDDKALTIQCPICTDQGYSVVALDCGHLVPTPEIDRPSSPAPQMTAIPKTMTRTPRGRLARTPLNSASSLSVFRPPPPEVIVQRVELASRTVNTCPITSISGQYQQRSRSQPRRCTSAYAKSSKKKVAEGSDGDKRNLSPPDSREKGRILGSKVLPIMALLLQKRAEESIEDKFDSTEDVEENRPETTPNSQANGTPNHQKVTTNKQKLAIQCVQLLPDAEPPLSNKPCSSRRQCRV